MLLSPVADADDARHDVIRIPRENKKGTLLIRCSFIVYKVFTIY